MEVLLESNWIEEVKAKENILIDKLKHTSIKKLNVAGLWAAIELQDFETTQQVAHQCVSNGLITDWFLFASNCLRIAPPLTISEEEIKLACEKIMSVAAQF